ncbi:MAG: MATE family efflux transporter [Rickettsiaceae bacterium]
MNQTNISSTLSPYKKGSIRELYSIFYPMMLACFSGCLMLFSDRVLLANYSTQSMNIATLAGNVFWVFSLGCISISSIAEIFVGRFSGNKEYQNIGIVTWQMLWFSMFSIIIFWPLSFAPHIFMPEHYLNEGGKEFFFYLMLSGPLFSATAALGGFFIGRGKAKIVASVLFIGNIINIILDFLLIFGLGDLIPELGIKGASIATVISEGFKVVILFSIFISKVNRDVFGTYIVGFHKKIFLDCIITGAPRSAGHVIELTSSIVVLSLLAQLDKLYVTIFSIGSTTFFFFSFLLDGLSRAVSAISSNFIGSKEYSFIKQTLFSSYKLLAIIILLLSIPLIIYPDFLIELWISKEYFELSNLNVKQILKINFIWVWIFFILKGYVWVISGFLVAAKDTRFMLIISIVSSWIFSVLPIYILIFNQVDFLKIIWTIMCIHVFFELICYFCRQNILIKKYLYKRGR